MDNIIKKIRDGETDIIIGEKNLDSQYIDILENIFGDEYIFIQECKEEYWFLHISREKKAKEVELLKYINIIMDIDNFRNMKTEAISESVERHVKYIPSYILVSLLERLHHTMVKLCKNFPIVKRCWCNSKKPTIKICLLRIKDYEVYLGEPLKRQEPFTFEIFVLIHWYKSFLEQLSYEPIVSYRYKPY
jgi:hypothetical protein